MTKHQKDKKIKGIVEMPTHKLEIHHLKWFELHFRIALEE